MAKYDFVPNNTGLYTLLRGDEMGILIQGNDDDNWGILKANQGQKYQGDSHYDNEETHSL